MSMIAENINRLKIAILGFQENYHLILYILIIAWAIHLLNSLLAYRLCVLGIIPRHIIGIPGIVLSPWIHGSWNHLFMNSLFFTIMGSLLLFEGVYTFAVASILIIHLSGILVWVFGNVAQHVGASSLIMGYWSFLLTRAYYHPDIIGLLAAATGFYYCGVHLTATLLSDEEGVSVIGHFSGFLSGILVGAYFSLLSPLGSKIIILYRDVMLACAQTLQGVFF